MGVVMDAAADAGRRCAAYRVNDREGPRRPEVRAVVTFSGSPGAPGLVSCSFGARERRVVRILIGQLTNRQNSCLLFFRVRYFLGGAFELEQEGSARQKPRFLTGFFFCAAFFNCCVRSPKQINRLLYGRGKKRYGARS